EVQHAQVVAINEWSDDFGSNVWYAYLLNTYQDTMEMALVVSQAEGLLEKKETKTSSLRHSYKEIAPFNAVRMELITEDVLALDNTFKVSFFVGNQMYNRDFTFKANTITEKNQIDIPELHTKGILAQ
ncbi:MAG: hypothetical protein KAG26_07810, partial [Methylococcales bacterium]|nr:hypothetical protein [Methylococcales bacterium]